MRTEGPRRQSQDKKGGTGPQGQKSQQTAACRTRPCRCSFTRGSRTQQEDQSEHPHRGEGHGSRQSHAHATQVPCVQGVVDPRQLDIYQQERNGEQDSESSPDTDGPDRGPDVHPGACRPAGTESVQQSIATVPSRSAHPGRRCRQSQSRKSQQHADDGHHGRPGADDPQVAEDRSGASVPGDPSIRAVPTIAVVGRT